MQQDHGVANLAGAIALRCAQRGVADIENRQAFAAFEAEILDDEIAFILVRPRVTEGACAKRGRSGCQHQGGSNGAEGHRILLKTRPERPGLQAPERGGFSAAEKVATARLSRAGP
jgi:hypothetical protein